MSKKVIILGSGPAGLTAALYTARANLNPLVIGGVEWGGQLMLTTDVENYPGFVEGIKGPDLMENFRKQAIRFGAEIINENVTSVDFKKNPFQVSTAENNYNANTIIIATGADSKWLGLSSEQKLIGRGVSSCATCDGFFFKNKNIVVVGGGDSAMEESLFLTKFANKVTVIHRRDKLRASKIMQERAFKNNKIEFVWDSEIVDVIGENSVTGIKIKNIKTNQVSEMEIQGLFIAIGHKPNTDFLKGQIDLNEKGYVIHNGTRTNIDGVFVAGDVYDFRYRQAVTAAGHGCQAAIDVEKFIEENNL
ncbi:MAG: thioredoxin-disulfide reductase [Thaumarchaeota archaeon]|nr:thioredoxin-disulfide reductase [Nitrososphaerota archaeon]